MRRITIYLTEEQERALDARARAEGVTRSAVLRRLLDQALDEPPVTDPAVAEAFAELADGYQELVVGLFEDDPDLAIDR